MCTLDNAATNALVLGVVRTVTGQPGVGLKTEFFAHLGMLRPARRIFYAPIAGSVAARGCQLVGFTPDSCMAAISVADLCDIVFGSLAAVTFGAAAFSPSPAAAVAVAPKPASGKVRAAAKAGRRSKTPR